MAERDGLCQRSISDRYLTGKEIHPFLFGSPPQVHQLYSYSLLVLIYSLDLLLSSLSDKPVGRWLVRDLHQAWGDSRWAISPLFNLPAGPLLRRPGVALTVWVYAWSYLLYDISGMLLSLASMSTMVACQNLGNTISNNTRSFYDLLPACLFKVASMLPQLSIGIKGIQSK